MKTRPRLKFVKYDFVDNESVVNTNELFQSFEDKDKNVINEFRKQLILAEYEQNEIDQTIDLIIKELHQLYLSNKSSFDIEIKSLSDERDRLYSKYYRLHEREFEDAREREEERQDRLERLSDWDDEAAIMRAVSSGNGDLIGY